MTKHKTTAPQMTRIVYDERGNPIGQDLTPAGVEAIRRVLADFDRRTADE